MFSSDAIYMMLSDFRKEVRGIFIGGDCVTINILFPHNQRYARDNITT